MSSNAWINTTKIDYHLNEDYESLRNVIKSLSEISTKENFFKKWEKIVSSDNDTISIKIFYGDDQCNMITLTKDWLIYSNSSWFTYSISWSSSVLSLTTSGLNWEEKEQNHNDEKFIRESLETIYQWIEGNFTESMKENNLSISRFASEIQKNLS